MLDSHVWPVAAVLDSTALDNLESRGSLLLAPPLTEMLPGLEPSLAHASHRSLSLC